MQFTVWRFSPKARVLIEFIVTAAFAIAVHFLIGDVMSQEPSLTANMTVYLELKSNLESIQDTESTAFAT
jgi:hypothetical protein